ncbi:MAG: methionine adenosyltransferase [Deltaproteobacteria bacterium]|nr:methionine adenosyltransferase [Deltaproteobacteria bacterium]
MSATSYLFTSESVTEGHPDKMADQVSDAILDAMLAQDIESRCAVETLFKTGVCLVAGEARTKAWVDMHSVVRKTIQDIGYRSSETGFDGHSCGVLSAIEGQSEDIAIGVDASHEKDQGAGDQGMMFGFACDETPELMPMPIALSHRLAKRLAHVRHSGKLGFLRPDGKCQVTIAYENSKPVGVDTIVMSSQHSPDVETATLREALVEEVIKPEIPEQFKLSSIKYHINPTGRFTIGGPMGDTGITGRKIIVDTYGGMGRHGGGCFSGKDPSKVDRSAAYMGRYIAKNIVAAGLAKRCEVQLAYAIGVAKPVSVMVETFGTSALSSEELARRIQDVFPLTPSRIVKHLNLLRPIYKKTSVYGHFGREEPEFTWEKTDMTEKLK